MVKQMTICFCKARLQVRPQLAVVQVRGGLLSHFVDPPRNLHDVKHRLSDRASPRSSTENLFAAVLEESGLSFPPSSFERMWIILEPVIFPNRSAPVFEVSTSDPPRADGGQIPREVGLLRSIELLSQLVMRSSPTLRERHPSILCYGRSRSKRIVSRGHGTYNESADESSDHSISFGLRSPRLLGRWTLATSLQLDRVYLTAGPAGRAGHCVQGHLSHTTFLARIDRTFDAFEHRIKSTTLARPTGDHPRTQFSNRVSLFQDHFFLTRSHQY